MLGTGVSAITFLTHPAKSYADNWVFNVQNFMAIISVIVTVTIFVPFFRRLRITTAYEYLEMRFNLATRMFCSISYVFSQFGRVGIVLFIPALALSAVTGFNIYACILFMGLLATFYTVLGGMEAVVWTDVMQVIILFGGAILCLIILLTDISGGVTEVITVGMEYDKFSMGSLSFDITTDTLWIMIAGQFFFAFLGVSDQTGVQRLLITKDEREARKSVWIWYIIVLFTGIIFYGLGTTLFVYYRANPLELNPTLQNDSILPWFIATKIPAGVAGLIVSAIFAASMSSVDSSMNSVATVAVVDYYRRFHRNAKEKHALIIARVVTLLMGIIAITIALVMAAYKEQIKSLLEFYWELHALLVATAAGIFLLGMLTKRANGKGAIVGAIAGSLALFLVKVYTPVHFLLYTAIGIVVGMAAGYLVSLLTGRPPEAKVEKLTIYTMKKD